MLYVVCCYVAIATPIAKPDDGRYRPKHVVFCFFML
jgi:hypothetical protein